MFTNDHVHGMINNSLTKLIHQSINLIDNLKSYRNFFFKIILKNDFSLLSRLVVNRSCLVVSLYNFSRCAKMFSERLIK